MGKKIILAVAGAGKTYYICHNIDPNKKNLILAFTHENIKNIRKELCDCFHGHIPDNTSVMTFHAFLFRILIRPYEPSIFSKFDTPLIKTNGVYMGEVPKQSILCKNGKYRPNPKYYKVESINHFLNEGKQYYCPLMSDLLMRLKPKNKKEFNRLGYILKSINIFYDSVYIDEFQDFREQDYSLLMEMANAANDVILVGDYYQHSVTAQSNTGIPFKKNKKSIAYAEFIRNMQSQGFQVDTSTLKLSRRCSDKVCDFVRRKLEININGNHETGEVIVLNSQYEKDKTRIKELLKDDTVTKLVYNNSNKYSGNYINWSYSKGDTFENICVILTDSTSSITEEKWKCDLTGSTKNKLYVALTRARNNVYLISNHDFKDCFINTDYNNN